jgi:hypothetical protein
MDGHERSSCGNGRPRTTLHRQEGVRSPPVNKLLGRSALGPLASDTPRSHGIVLTTKLTTNQADNREAAWTVVHRRPGETTGADRNIQVGES